MSGGSRTIAKPRKPASSVSQDQTQEVVAPLTGLLPANQRLRVLLVEDVVVVAMEVGRMLKDLGCEVVASAASYPDAMECIRRGGYDVILLDVELNGKDVWPLVDDLLDRRVPLIFTTGHACPESLPPEFRHLPYLEKPFDRHELGAKLAEALSAHGSPAR